ncbi:MAG: hypothetical protein ACPIOQ_14345, partial [Promethearchaeia archaeon]
MESCEEIAKSKQLASRGRVQHNGTELGRLKPGGLGLKPPKTGSARARMPCIQALGYSSGRGCECLAHELG